MSAELLLDNSAWARLGAPALAQERAEELMALPHLHIDEEIELRAIDAQRQLARAGHHRLPPVDLVVAALADRHEIGILHYDLLAAKTDLRFASVWLAPRGTL